MRKDEEENEFLIASTINVTQRNLNIDFSLNLIDFLSEIIYNFQLIFYACI